MLSPAQRIKASILCVAYILGGGLETITMAAIYPTAMALIDIESVAQKPYVSAFLEFIGEQNTQNLVFYAIFALCALLLLSSTVQISLLYGLKRFIASSVISQSHRLVTKCVNAPYTWHHDQNSAILIRRIFGDISKWQNGFLQSILQIFHSVIMLIVAAWVVLALSPKDGILILSVIGVLSLLIVLISRPHIQKLGFEQRSISDIFMKNLYQTFAGIKDIKVNNREKYFTGLAYQNRYGMQHARLIQSLWEGIPPLLLLTVGQIGFLLLLYVFWKQGMEKAQIVGQMALLGMVASRLIPAINRLTGSLAGFWDSLPYVEGLQDIVNSVDAVSHRTMIFSGVTKLNADWQSIRFQKLTYQYPTGKHAALSNVDLTFERGKFYGVVGFSGAGKSTLVDVLLGLIPPTSGDIIFGTTPYKDIDIKSWQKNIGYVPQAPYIADDNVIANIAFGVHAKDVDEGRIWKALALAELEDVIRSLPDGLNTRLGENGVSLSGGQIQRIAIARALHQNPKVLILDEATSALDSETESKIQTAIEGLQGAITTIAIAHRISTLKNSDQIIVCDQGRVVQTGTYDELMENSDIFRRLAFKDTSPQTSSEFAPT